jgi:hypothetical protein
MDDFPWIPRQVHNGVTISCQTRPFATNFFESIKRVSLVLSADGNTIVFWPFWSSCMHKCIPLLDLRFLCVTHTYTPKRNVSRAADKINKNKRSTYFELVWCATSDVRQSDVRHFKSWTIFRLLRRVFGFNRVKLAAVILPSYKMTAFIEHLHNSVTEEITGRPDWAIFRLMCDWLLWAVYFENYRSSANIWAMFSKEQVMY